MALGVKLRVKKSAAPAPGHPTSISEPTKATTPAIGTGLVDPECIYIYTWWEYGVVDHNPIGYRDLKLASLATVLRERAAGHRGVSTITRPCGGAHNRAASSCAAGGG